MAKRGQILSLVYFGDKISCIQGWVWTCFIAEDDTEHLIPIFFFFDPLFFLSAEITAVCHHA